MTNIIRKKIPQVDELPMLSFDSKKLSDIISYLETVKEEYGDDATLVFNLQYAYYDDYDIVCEIRYTQLETIEAAEARIEKDAKKKESSKRAADTRKKNKDLREREMFEKLKAKFEK